MFRPILITVLFALVIGGYHPLYAQKEKQGTSDKPKKDVKFLYDIVVDVPVSSTSASTISSKPLSPISVSEPIKSTRSNELERAGYLQFKYALLLDMEVEQLQNLNVFKVIDEWMGTRYQLGGSTKAGIDCSAFMQVLFTALYGITLPRTAHDQYMLCRKISRTELKIGDLLFFNTVGGVSHVGMYLQNNKFVHASSGGVTISDLYDDYWVRRFISAGRIDNIQLQTLSSQP